MTPAERSFWWTAMRHAALRGRISRFQWIGGELAEFVSHDARLVIDIAPEVDRDAVTLTREVRLRAARYARLALPACDILRDVHRECERLAAMLDLMIAGMGRRKLR